MKLDCDLVRDLYPLYEEKELSPNSKNQVDAHLQQCAECKQVYDTGSGFGDLVKSAEVSVPKTLDEKISLRLKLQRMKIVVIFLLTIILVSMGIEYKNEREEIFELSHSLYRETETLVDLLRKVKNSHHDNFEMAKYELFEVFEAKKELEKYLNFIEKKKYQDTEYYLKVQDDQLIKMFEMMQLRYEQGVWSKEDEEVYSLIKSYFTDYQSLIRKQYNDLQHGYSSYFEFVQVEEIESYVSKINEVSYSYLRFHQSPDDVEEWSKDQLLEKIRTVFHTKKNKVKIRRESSLNGPIGTYFFEVGTTKGQRISGEIDGYTGNIIKADSSYGQGEGVLLDEKIAEKEVTVLLKSLYGKDVPFKVTFDETINEIAAIYQYSFSLEYEGYRLYTPFNHKNTIQIDARSGELIRLDASEMRFVTKELIENLDPTVSIGKEQGVTIVNKIIQNEPNHYAGNEIGDLPYNDTVIIHSILSGEYEIVHLYGNKDQAPFIFINTRTGLEEPLYFWDH